MNQLEIEHLINGRKSLNMETIDILRNRLTYSIRSTETIVCFDTEHPYYNV